MRVTVLLPKSHSKQFVTTHNFLPTLGNGRLPTFGDYTVQIDLGFSKLFKHTFKVSKLSYGI